MPEGPELHLASKFVNLVCRSRVFSGKIVKSEVSKHADVEWGDEDYIISATSRGKELKLTMTEASSNTSNKKPANKKSLDILFNFGMSGKFDFYEAGELKKHAHLNFFTKDEPKMILSFVDYRRFGKWQIGADWSEDRGPCVTFEYSKFRENVLSNLNNSAFNKPICEALLNQKYFNGIGNYLRAEILYRAGIPPFVSARSVLEPLAELEKVTGEGEFKIKSETPDILQLCNILPLEVVNLGGTGYDPEGRDPDYSKFSEWLQCYYNPDMKNMADHNKRTIWYSGNPGPMAPKDLKVRGMKKSSKVAKNKQEKSPKGDTSADEEQQSDSKPKSTKVTRKVLKETEDEDIQATEKKQPRKSAAKAGKSTPKRLKSTPSQKQARKSTEPSKELHSSVVNGSSKRPLKRKTETDVNHDSVEVTKPKQKKGKESKGEISNGDIVRAAGRVTRSSAKILLAT